MCVPPPARTFVSELDEARRTRARLERCEDCTHQDGAYAPASPTNQEPPEPLRAGRFYTIGAGRLGSSVRGVKRMLRCVPGVELGKHSKDINLRRAPAERGPAARRRAASRTSEGCRSRPSPSSTRCSPRCFRTTRYLGRLDRRACTPSSREAVRAVAASRRWESRAR
jgi:hypothetical protein